MKRFRAGNPPDAIAAHVHRTGAWVTLTSHSWGWSSGDRYTSADITAKQARRLAEWLNAAADELDARS